MATPHLFTHLFHSGVIVSTRKLVYDAGSAEESIKSLMQAQHKAVLKDLRRGHFDDKIDSYLGGTPGLLARGSEAASERAEALEAGEPTDPGEAGELEAPSENELSPDAVEEIVLGAATEEVFDEPSVPVIIVEKTPPPVRPTRSIPPLAPPPIPVRPPTTERALPLARAPAAVDTTLRTEAPTFEPRPAVDQSAEIEISVDDEDGAEAAPPAGRRAARDTAENDLPIGHQTRPTLTLSDTKPTLGMINEEAKRAAAVIDATAAAARPTPPQIPPPPDARKLGERPSTINAATLPPARPISRPSSSRPALSQPQVVSRPLASDDRNRRESEAVEVYSPALPSAELPPDVRPGQYAQHKKVSTRIPLEGLKPDRPAPVPVPAGLGRPPRSPTAPPKSGSVPPAGASAVVAPREPVQRLPNQTEPLRARVPTPSRVTPPPTAPVVSRTASAGVVMTRPGVIVGAPGKSGATTTPRIRKAREDEGRGFGQGLISEKSLDEVILAYLSEDADEK